MIQIYSKSYDQQIVECFKLLAVTNTLPFRIKSYMALELLYRIPNHRYLYFHVCKRNLIDNMIKTKIVCVCVCVQIFYNPRIYFSYLYTKSSMDGNRLLLRLRKNSFLVNAV